MKFAKIIFRIAAIWGVLVLTPLYFMFDLIGRNDPPPITHPAFFYGFIGAGLAWQIAFFFIATDPVRYRPLMIPSIFEKFSYGIAVVILVAQHRMRPLRPCLRRRRSAAWRSVCDCIPENAKTRIITNHVGADVLICPAERSSASMASLQESFRAALGRRGHLPQPGS